MGERLPCMPKMLLAPFKHSEGMFGCCFKRLTDATSCCRPLQTNPLGPDIEPTQEPNKLVSVIMKEGQTPSKDP